MRKELERCRAIIRKAESQDSIPTKEEVRQMRQSSEEDWLEEHRDIVIWETYEEAKLRAWELEERLEAVEE